MYHTEHFLCAGDQAENLIPMASFNPHSPPTWEVLLSASKQSNLTCLRLKEVAKLDVASRLQDCRKDESTSQAAASAWLWESTWVLLFISDGRADLLAFLSVDWTTRTCGGGRTGTCVRGS